MDELEEIGLEILKALNERSHTEREILNEIKEIRNEIKEINRKLGEQCLLKGDNMVKKEYVKKSVKKGEMII